MILWDLKHQEKQCLFQLQDQTNVYKKKKIENKVNNGSWIRKNHKSNYLRNAIRNLIVLL